MKKGIVIGGTKGIGNAIVEKLLSSHYEVMLTARSRTDVDDKVTRHKENGGHCKGAVIDISSEESIINCKNFVMKELQSIDYLILNASALSGHWKEAIDTDLLGTVNCIKHFIPLLKPNAESQVIFIGSKAAAVPTPGFEAYGSVKAALVHYMKTLSVSLADINIRVNVVSPGDTFEENGFWDKIRKNNPELFGNIKNLRGYKRFCKPQEVADTVAFLLSQEATFINGANIYVDGGSQDIVRY